MAHKTICSRCGGYGGEPAVNIDPTERPGVWHPCYHCGMTGFCCCEECEGECACSGCGEPLAPGDKAYAEDDADGSVLWYCDECAEEGTNEPSH